MQNKFNSFKNISNVVLYFFVLVFIVIPTTLILIFSFCTADDLGNITSHFTLENFHKLFSPVYSEVVMNSLKIAFITTILVLLFAYPLAYIVSSLNRRTQLIMLLLILLPYWTNSLVRTYSFMFILRADGIINKIMILLGIISEPLQLLYTESAVIASMIYLFLPVMFLPIYSSVEKIDKTYIEASRDLGASKIYTFFKIIVPLSVPGIVAGSIMVFTPCLGLFYISDLVGGGKTVLLGSIIRDQFATTRNLPFGAALSVIMMIMALIIIVFYSKVSLNGEKYEK